MFQYLLYALGAIGVLLGLRFLLRAFLLRDKPRIQHYYFAHKALPHAFFGNPAGLIMPLIATATDRADVQGADLLRSMWKDSDILPDPEAKLEWNPSSFAVEFLDPPRIMAVVLTLPPPARRAEAFFVAMVFDSIGLAAGQAPRCRYFALEFIRTRPDGVATYLSEWSEGGSGKLKYTIRFHDVEPTIPAFLARIKTLLPESAAKS